MRIPSAALGSAVFFVIAPGSFAGLVPWWITRWRLEPAFFGLEALRYVGVALIVLGLVPLIEIFRAICRPRGNPRAGRADGKARRDRFLSLRAQSHVCRPIRDPRRAGAHVFQHRTVRLRRLRRRGVPCFRAALRRTDADKDLQRGVPRLLRQCRALGAAADAVATRLRARSQDLGRRPHRTQLQPNAGKRDATLVRCQSRIGGGSMPDMYRLSTDEIREAERFDLWRESARSMHGVTEDWDARSESAFRGAAEVSMAGSLRRLRVTSAVSVSRRGERDIAELAHGAYMIFRETGAGSRFDNGRTSFELRRDHLTVMDFDAPCTLAAPHGFDCELMILPKTFVDPHLLLRKRPLALQLSGRPGFEALAAAYYRSLLREWDAISGDQIASAADALGRLIGVASGAIADEHAEAIARARLAEVERYINANLASPSLSAASAAAALKLSERALYSLFERQGVSFAERVRRRRLEECRIALIARPSRPVIDIAFAWGFGSLPSFYRAFQAEFGASPSDVRSAARVGAQLAPAQKLRAAK